MASIEKKDVGAIHFNCNKICCLLPEIEERLGFMYLQVAHGTFLAGLEIFHYTALAN